MKIGNKKENAEILEKLKQTQWENEWKEKNKNHLFFKPKRHFEPIKKFFRNKV